MINLPSKFRFKFIKKTVKNLFKPIISFDDKQLDIIIQGPGCRKRNYDWCDLSDSRIAG